MWKKITRSLDLNHIFVTQPNHLNIFVTIGGIKTYRLLESRDEVEKIKHFNAGAKKGPGIM